MKLSKRGLFNENGDIETSKRRVINGNTTNLNDFNNLKYSWTSAVSYTHLTLPTT